MRTSKRKIDRFFLITTIALTVFGFLIFLSASLGLLAQTGVSFQTVALKQSISLIIGIVMFIQLSKLPYHWLRKLALFILIGAIIVNLLLFIPGITLTAGGATRWLDFGPLSFQPSELLKVSFIIYLGAWIHFARDRITTLKFGLIPYVILLLILSVLLIAQSDTDTLVVIAATGLTMLLVAGLRLRYVIAAMALMIAVVVGIVIMNPYAQKRVETYLDRGADAKGSGYQINQSKIAIGSGQLTGRGFGQSVQKFGYLPQPTDDSIFAVAAEEFGFVGAVGLVLLYLLFAASAFRISIRAPDVFGGIVVIGIAVLIIIESFMNIGAMIGLIPLSGMPLLFVSHGGTALIITLMIAGIIANVSKHAKSA